MKNHRTEIVISGEQIGLGDLWRIATQRASVALDPSPAFRERLARSESLVHDALTRGDRVYGLTTGFGASCGSDVAASQVIEQGRRLVAYHRAGVGAPFDPCVVRAATAARLITLSQARSGVSFRLLETLVQWINSELVPVVPSLGSVGASGDLTPMAYVAAALAGEGTVWLRGVQTPAAEAMESVNIKPYVLQGREALAMINGTAMMTGVAVRAVMLTRRFIDAIYEGSALTMHGLQAHLDALSDPVVDAKGHPGQQQVGRGILNYLESVGDVQEARDPNAFQDPYSIRCMPQIVGALVDTEEWVATWVRRELNGVSDNPVADTHANVFRCGGNFFGGHVVVAMDALRIAVAHAADAIDRQVALLVDEKFNRGLPANLVSQTGDGSVLNHGFKAAQITASALVAEIQGLTMPAAISSRSTESHNQDIVSMGTISARRTIEALEHAATLAAIHWLVGAQAAELRGGLEQRKKLQTSVNSIRQLSPAVTNDRPLDHDIDQIRRLIFAEDIYS